MNHGHTIRGMSLKTRIWAHLGLPEASGGQTGQTSVEIKVAKGQLEQFASVFWYLGLINPSSGYKIPKIQKSRFFFKNRFFF